MNYDQLLVDCDTLLKAGKISSVNELIRHLNFSKVPRKYRQALGKICRRSGLIESGLRLLHPIIRSELALQVPASAAEICEYAVLLSRNGSIDEALKLLDSVDVKEAPEALLYQGFCHVSNWNYQQAASDFEKYLNSEIDTYSKLIAQVNLIASYVANGQLDRAASLLDETLLMAQEFQALRLIGNCLELRAQVSFFRGDFAQARQDLQRSLEVLSQSGSYDQLLIHKWQSTMTALETQDLEPLSKFSAEALEKRHWESVRDTDFYRLKIKFDQKMLDHLLFGTPSPFYCRRVEKELPQKPSEFYIYGSDQGRILDLQTGEIAGSDEISGTKIHQMISALLTDFYAPCNVGELFAEIYPDEYFDINSSPVRIRQVLRRVRRWLEANSIPASIEESKGSYKFVINGEFGIRIPFERSPVENTATLWQKALMVFQTDGAFSAEEACQKLQISRTSFHRLSTWAIENKYLIKTGRNRATVYRISSEKIRKGA